MTTNEKISENKYFFLNSENILNELKKTPDNEKFNNYIILQNDILHKKLELLQKENQLLKKKNIELEDDIDRYDNRLRYSKNMIKNFAVLKMDYKYLYIESNNLLNNIFLYTKIQINCFKYIVYLLYLITLFDLIINYYLYPFNNTLIMYIFIIKFLIISSISSGFKYLYKLDNIYQLCKTIDKYNTSSTDKLEDIIKTENSQKYIEDLIDNL